MHHPLRVLLLLCAFALTAPLPALADEPAVAVPAPTPTPAGTGPDVAKPEVTAPAPENNNATGGKPPEQATTLWRDRSCNFFVVKSSWGYTLYEYLWGPWPSEGDVIEGRLDGFGTRAVTNRTVESKQMTVYSEVNSTSRKYVAGKIPGFCKHRKEFTARVRR